MRCFFCSDYNSSPTPSDLRQTRPTKPSYRGGWLRLYLGRRPEDAFGATPTNFPIRSAESLDNIKSILEAAHLSTDNLVYLQVYLEDINNYAALDESFVVVPKNPPARSVIGVAKLPEPQIQINAIAVRDLAGRQVVAPQNFEPSKSHSAGILTSDRLFISTMPGADPNTGKIPTDPAAQVDAHDGQFKAVNEAAGLTLANMVFVNSFNLPTKSHTES